MCFLIEKARGSTSSRSTCARRIAFSFDLGLFQIKINVFSNRKSPGIDIQAIDLFGQSAPHQRQSSGPPPYFDVLCFVPARVLERRHASLCSPRVPSCWFWEAERFIVPAIVVFKRLLALDAAILRLCICPPTCQPFLASAASVNFSASCTVRVWDFQLHDR